MTLDETKATAKVIIGAAARQDAIERMHVGVAAAALSRMLGRAFADIRKAAE